MPQEDVGLGYASTGQSKIMRGGGVPSLYTAASWFTEPWISQSCFAEQNAVRVVVVKTDRKLRSINEWKERLVWGLYT